MSDIRWDAGAPVTALSTELDSLANNAGALGAAVDADAEGYLYGDAFLSVTFGSAPTSGSLVELYIVRGDGTSYEDASTTGPVTPSHGYVGGFVLRNITSAQVVCIPGIPLPPKDFKVMAVNRSGQAFPASGSTVTIVPYREQAV